MSDFDSDLDVFYKPRLRPRYFITKQDHRGILRYEEVLGTAVNHEQLVAGELIVIMKT